MKKIAYLLIIIVLSVLRTRAQETAKSPEYKVPSTYHFDNKVIYEINNEEKKTPETAIYYFTKNGDYMSVETCEKYAKEGQPGS